MSRTSFQCFEGIGHPYANIVVGMNPNPSGHFGQGLLSDPSHLRRQGATVGVAQHYGVGTCFSSRNPRSKCILRLILVAIKGMLGIVEHLTTLGFQEGHGVRNHGDVFRGSRAEHLLDMQEPGLAKNGYYRGLGLQKQGHLRVFFHRDFLTPGGTKSSDLGVLPTLLGSLLEEFNVARIGARPTPFDVVNAKGIKALGQPNLISDREIDAFTLGTIPQGRVVNFDVRFLEGHTAAFFKSRSI